MFKRQKWETSKDHYIRRLWGFCCRYKENFDPLLTNSYLAYREIAKVMIKTRDYSQFYNLFNSFLGFFEMEVDGEARLADWDYDVRNFLNEAKLPEKLDIFLEDYEVTYCGCGATYYDYDNDWIDKGFIIFDIEYDVQPQARYMSDYEYFSMSGLEEENDADRFETSIFEKLRFQNGGVFLRDYPEDGGYCCKACAGIIDLTQLGFPGFTLEVDEDNCWVIRGKAISKIPENWKHYEESDGHHFILKNGSMEDEDDLNFSEKIDEDAFYFLIERHLQDAFAFEGGSCYQVLTQEEKQQMYWDECQRIAEAKFGIDFVGDWSIDYFDSDDWEREKSKWDYVPAKLTTKE